MESWMIESGLAVGMALVGALAAAKDKMQQNQIDSLKEEHKVQCEKLNNDTKLLFIKHDADVSALQDMQIKVAENYHKKPEIDEKFKRLEEMMITGFAGIRSDIQKLFETTHRGQ